MLQKQSKQRAGLKYLVLIPVIAGILTYVGCTDDNGLAENKAALTLEEQVADLEATLDAKEEISIEERKLVSNLLNKANQKALPPPPPPPSLNEDAVIEVVETQSQKEINDVPFAVVEEVPVFPGCESLQTNAERKKCMSEQVSQLINANFNTKVGEELQLKGVQRIYTRFRINENGDIVDIESRASVPELEKEAERVVSLLPKITPGKHKGKNVGVLYSLPIVFQTK
tara:strand:- start:294 stop:977 length:684 start_codon:yes stop_codon:yes gene_type:complete